MRSSTIAKLLPLLLGLMIAGLLALASIASWDSIRAESVLEASTPAEVEMVQPTEFSISASSAVVITVDQVQTQEIAVAVGGVITSLSAPGPLPSGAEVARVSDVPIFAFAGAAPLVSDVSPGDRGANVQRASSYLSSLGYAVDPTTQTAGQAFTRAASQYNAARGRAGDGDVLRSSGLAWIGSNPTVDFTPVVALGGTVSEGSVLGSGAVTAARAQVDEPDDLPRTALGQILVGSWGDISINYQQGSGSLDGATAIALASSGRVEFGVTLSLPNPIAAVAVPSGAMSSGADMQCVTTRDNSGHIEMVSVVVIDEQPGIVLLEPGGVPATIIVNPWILPDGHPCE